jgi:hypothetical protein
VHVPLDLTPWVKVERSLEANRTGLASIFQAVVEENPRPIRGVSKGGTAGLVVGTHTTPAVFYPSSAPRSEGLQSSPPVCAAVSHQHCRAALYAPRWHAVRIRCQGCTLRGFRLHRLGSRRDSRALDVCAGAVARAQPNAASLGGDAPTLLKLRRPQPQPLENAC